MGFNTNGRTTYVRESLENVLPKLGLPREHIPVYIDKLLSNLSPHGPILDQFFDFPRSARIHARQSGLGYEQAYQAVTSDPLVLLEIHDVLKGDGVSLNTISKAAPIGRRKKEDAAPKDFVPRAPSQRKNAKLLPDNETIATCAIAYKEKHGHLPNTKSSGSLSHDGGLPETSPGWTGVINRLREERGTTLGTLVRLKLAGNKEETPAPASAPATAPSSVKKAEPENITAPTPEPVKKRRDSLPLPDNDTIAMAAKAFKAKHGHFPNMSSGGEMARDGGLPETSPVWSGIIKRLPEERSSTIGKLVKAYDARTGEVTPAPANGMLIAAEKTERQKGGRVSIPLPDNETIAKCAKAFKDAHGHVPTPKAAGDLSRAGGLPETSPVWTSIVKRLPQERGTTIGKLVAQHERALEEKVIAALPRRTARWAFAQAVHDVQRKGTIVIDEQMELLFRHKKIEGLAEIVGYDKDRKITSAVDFLVAAGIATLDKRKNLVPAPPPVIAQYARLLAQ